MVQQYLAAGAAVAPGVVMVQLQVQIVAQGIEAVVAKLRQQPAAHLAGAGIGNGGVPVDAVSTQALGKNRQIKMSNDVSAG